MTDKNKTSDLDGREIPFLIMLVGGAAWYQFGGRVQVWFHEHLIQIVLLGSLFLAILGYVIVRRFNKKNKEDVDRMLRLQEARASKGSSSQYYRRPFPRSRSRNASYEAPPPRIRAGTTNAHGSYLR